MNYALIENGIVINMIVIAPYNLSDFPSAIPVGDKPVGIGDEYRDGKFYRDGKEILSELEQTRVMLLAAEQQLTDADLALMAAEKEITDRDLQLMEVQSQ